LGYSPGNDSGVPALAYIDELAKMPQFGPKFARALQFWTDPLLHTLSDDLTNSQKTLFVALTGSPGTGKAPQAYYIEDELTARGFKVASLSVRDFTMSLHAREFLAQRVHPLFINRGIAGTHDMQGLRKVLEALGAPTFDAPIHVPTFDIKFDVRANFSRWKVIEEKPDIVLVRGWCLGAIAQESRELAVPVNEIEAQEDPDGVFRRAVNDRIRSDYQPLYHFFDRWIVRQAPSFDTVRRWRMIDERERRTREGSEAGIRGEQELHRYLSLLERTVRDMMRALPPRAHYLFTLNEERLISSYTTANGA
jgi:D-glycerate 3-kinase